MLGGENSVQGPLLLELQATHCHQKWSLCPFLNQNAACGNFIYFLKN